MYTEAVDVWSCGCVVAEMAALDFLFPGTSTADQLARIAATIGPPDADSWPEGLTRAKVQHVQFEEKATDKSLESLLSKARHTATPQRTLPSLVRTRARARYERAFSQTGRPHCPADPPASSS